ncbi:hypothetical protein G9A89_008480 [Geosiphon pyriformis]|nr:hypothetical protein G9A89_008480 [Geosiphon pyriformis]
MPTLKKGLSLDLPLWYSYDARAAAEKDDLEALDIIIKHSTAKSVKKVKNLCARTKYDISQFWYTSYWEDLEMEY